LLLPAICNSCGKIFSSGIEIIDSSHVSFSGNIVGPCPNCGGNGHIPDGLYNFIGNTIELLSGPCRTVSELKRLQTILNQACKNRTSLEDVSKRIQEDIPELSSLKDLFPKTRSEFYGFLAVIIAIISLILGHVKDDRPAKVELRQVLNVICQPQITNKTIAPRSEVPMVRKRK
jgi:hypothetical protein